MMILNKMIDMDIDTLQIGTHPLLTVLPAGYPLLKAADVVAKKNMGLIN